MCACDLPRKVREIFNFFFKQKAFVCVFVTAKLLVQRQSSMDFYFANFPTQVQFTVAGNELTFFIHKFCYLKLEA